MNTVSNDKLPNECGIKRMWSQLIRLERVVSNEQVSTVIKSDRSHFFDSRSCSEDNWKFTLRLLCRLWKNL